MKNFEPYYAVIFTSTRTNGDNEYATMAKTMEDLAMQQPGFLGVESARNDIGITVSYWKTLDDISAWKQQTNHILAQKLGKTNWYEWYKVRICKVEREYEFFK
ncbi:antibiotic biosynthesis monooxygenase [Tamlana sp. 62-3]|uniref:Antibiotic biosynthesis monooxygenase n=1 Tax=Neotamlana sargassicola TaxID=2883125 RepID=A0A9X1I689_9FLAO|nr:antibiotic biosynthesis monooxygenase [Tamlana sargassicola]MCB4807159.1 antibiotic biosynthesis monooxygenase [Tamlana sargassicola]